LFRIFNNLAAEDAIVKKTLHASLEHRWGKTDQQLMILGVFFNPYLRARCFNRDVLSANAMFHMVRRAFERLLNQTAVGDIDFLNAFRSYYDATDYFSDESMWLEGHAESYKTAVSRCEIRRGVFTQYPRNRKSRLTLFGSGGSMRVLRRQVAADL
jgi:hypothetical protein